MIRYANCKESNTAETARNRIRWRKVNVNTLLLKLHLKLEEFATREEGQDMVEYALVVALLTFGATAAIKFLAAGLSTAYGNISTTLGSYTS